MTTKPHNHDVLVFFSFKSHKKGYYKTLFDRLTSQAADFGLTLHQGSLKDLVISYKDNKMEITETMTGRDLSSFGLVYFELFTKAPQQALAAAAYLDRKRVPYFSPQVRQILPDSKLAEMALLADNGLSIPDGITSSNTQLKSIFRADHPIEYPFILKSVKAFGGAMNFLVHDYAELVAHLDENPQETFIIQSFIPNQFDYRVLIFGGEVKLVLKRSRNSAETHLNNTSKGAAGEFLDPSELTEAQIADTLKAAKLLGREEFCGLDLIINELTGEHSILEINESPGIELGIDPEKKMGIMLAYMKSRMETQS
jgi:glutathione synthase/RimK-type ligase-like ATP-grasp enzyme